MLRFFFFIAPLLFSLLTSCQQKDSGANDLQKARLNLVSDPRGLDPRKSQDLNERILMNMFFEGLTRTGKTGKSELALADRVDVQNSGLRYVFHLRGAFWSNGDKILAKDFIYSWKSSLSPEFPSENAHQLFCIKNASAIKRGEKISADLGAIELDDLTLQVDLEYPVPYFLELLSFSIFFPVHEAMDRCGWDLSQHDLISSGPFSLKKWKHHDFIDTVKNLEYWDASQVRLEGIHFVMVTEDTEIRMFEKNELDWSGSPLSRIPVDLINGFKEKELLKVGPILRTSFFRMNVSTPPFNNANIRRAFSLSINRNALVEHVCQGKGSSALSFVPFEMGIYTEPYFVDYHEEEAARCFEVGLKELGMTREDFPKVACLYAGLQNNSALVQAVQQDWRRVLGVQIDLEVNERKAYFGRVRQKDYQIALGDWVADFNDPANFLNIFKHKTGSSNNTEWENIEYANLLSSSETAEGSEREALLRKCESILMQEMPIAPIYHPMMCYIKQDRLQGMVLSYLGNLDFKWAYLHNPE